MRGRGPAGGAASALRGGGERADSPQRRADHPGQPVVGVDDVEAAAARTIPAVNSPRVFTKAQQESDALTQVPDKVYLMNSDNQTLP